MDKDDILTFIRNNPVFFLATSEEGQPHGWIITVFQADENGIIFATGKKKDVYKQLRTNPLVELLFWDDEEQKQITITGSVEFSDELELKKRVVEKFKFLKPWVDKEGYDQLASFHLKDARAFVWTKEVDFDAKKYVHL